ncbi:hypothetical protein ACCC84_10120 [Serratia odorifera]|uniref:hypothetical protein n=1 Tax=Serratia odorifera TaxID=618 RepID=UPI003532246C
MTLTTERQQFEQWWHEEYCHLEGSSEAAFVKHVAWEAMLKARELMANREAQPVAEPYMYELWKWDETVPELDRWFLVERSHEKLVAGKEQKVVILYTAPPAPAGEVVVTRNEHGDIVAVTRQDVEGRVIEVIAESNAPPAPVVPDELVEELGTWKTPDVVFGWNKCRSAMLAAVPEYDILEDYRAEMLKRVTFGWDGKSSCNANSPEIPEGWKLVPVEPTEKMVINGFESNAMGALSAAANEENGWPYGCRESAEFVKGIYMAMLAATPEGGN